MEFVASNERESRGDATCRVHEYLTRNREINGAVIELDGRYPETGWSVNSRCTAMIFVMKGEGSVTIENKEYALYPGDQVIVSPRERYWLQGEGLQIYYASTPPWDSAQYNVVV